MPHTYACCTTASSACSERRRGSQKLGKELPLRRSGVPQLISPAPMPPRLQEARQVAALAQLGDPQVYLTRPHAPAPRAIPVALRRAVLGPALTTASANQLGHLHFHHLRRDGLDGLADHISVLIEQHLL